MLQQMKLGKRTLKNWGDFWVQMVEAKAIKIQEENRKIINKINEILSLFSVDYDLLNYSISIFFDSKLYCIRYEFHDW